MKIANTKYEIYTPSGFQPFDGIRSLKKDSYFDISLSNGKRIQCSLTHPFICNSKEVLAKDIKKGDKIDSSGIEPVIVEDIKLKDGLAVLYDIINSDGGNIFNVDGIISHNCDFLSSGATVVDPNILEDMLSQTVQDPMEKRGYDGTYWIWKPIDYSKDYMVVADVARGDGTDFSAFHVIDVETVEQVAEYRGKIGTKDFGNFLVSVATEWNDAMLIIENTGVGWAAIQPAIDRNYPNLYYTNRDAETATPEKFFQKRYDVKNKADMVPGFTTSTKTRPLLVSKLELYCRERACIIRSKRLINELQVFIWHPNGKPEAQPGYNDDLVMAFAIGMFIRDTALKLRQQGIELTKRSMNNIGSSVVYSSNEPTIKPNVNPWEQNIGNNLREDLTWLIK